MTESKLCRKPIEYWRIKGGKLIKISDMDTLHLKRTIAMLHRQIDGSLHDNFCWDNISAMEEELRKRGISNGEDCER